MTQDLAPRLEPHELKRRLLESDTPAPWIDVYGWSLEKLTDRQFLEMFYPDQSFYTSSKMTGGFVDAALRYYDPDKGPLLSIGCGVGNMNRTMARAGIDQIDGIDIDPSALDCARAITEAEGLDISYRVANFTDDADLSAQKYSVIVCESVLEHIEEYREWIKRLGELTASGGSVLLVVPSVLGGWSLSHDWDWKRFRWKAQAFNYHPGQHVNHFWFRTLKKEFAAEGFKVSEVRKNQAFLAIYASVFHKIRRRVWTKAFSYPDYWLSKFLPKDVATRLVVFEKIAE
jgi:2-polyprenyl-3-methyl-5-hydroxy-6-metoxy-1,4-benzoquinol methylase